MLLLQITLATIGFIALLVFLVRVGREGYEMYLETQASYKETLLNNLFKHCWNGTERDRPYAWFRVIQHLRHFQPDPELIRMAKIRREQSMRIKSAAWQVDENGRLIVKDDDNPDLEVA